jgi:hypothetical protein
LRICEGAGLDVLHLLARSMRARSLGLASASLRVRRSG